MRITLTPTLSLRERGKSDGASELFGSSLMKIKSGEQAMMIVERINLLPLSLRERAG